MTRSLKVPPTPPVKLTVIPSEVSSPCVPMRFSPLFTGNAPPVIRKKAGVTSVILDPATLFCTWKVKGSSSVVVVVVEVVVVVVVVVAGASVVVVVVDVVVDNSISASVISQQVVVVVVEVVVVVLLVVVVVVVVVGQTSAQLAIPDVISSRIASSSATVELVI